MYFLNFPLPPISTLTDTLSPTPRLSDLVKAAAVEKYGKGFVYGLDTMRFANGGFVSRMASSPAIDYDRLAGALSGGGSGLTVNRSEEHTSELKSLMRISYAVF